MNVQEFEGPEFEAAVEKFLAGEPITIKNVRFEIRGRLVAVSIALNSALQTSEIFEADDRLDKAEDVWLPFLEHAPDVQEYVGNRKVFLILVESLDNPSPVCRRTEDHFEWAAGFPDRRPGASGFDSMDFRPGGSMRWRGGIEAVGFVTVMLLAFGASTGAAWGVASWLAPEISVAAAIFSGLLFIHAVVGESFTEKLIVLGVLMIGASFAFPRISFLEGAASYPNILLSAGIGLAMGTVLASLASALVGGESATQED